MQSNVKTLNYKNWLLKAVFLLTIIVASFYVSYAFAGDTSGSKTLGDIATGITGSFSGLAQLLIAISYLAGIGFVLAAIFKFKQHKDNPTQIPLGTPVAMLVIGIVLIFLPMIFGPAGTTIFGTNATPGGITGKGYQTIPGSTSGQ